jgi:hypothetical protein
MKAFGLHLKNAGFLVLAGILSRAVAGASAQQEPQRPIQLEPIAAEPPQGQKPIVIPPAIVGLAAAPDELQKALDESTLPKAVPELLVELSTRANDIAQTIASGAFGQVWVPAMATKTVALVLEAHTSELPNGPRERVATALKQVVTSAWELDTYGDLGEKAKIDQAYARLAEGITKVKAEYAKQ